MANIIRAVFAVFWLFATGFLGMLVYIVMQTEPSPSVLWGWFVMCGLSFVSASFLAYNIIFSRHHGSGHHHHDGDAHQGSH